MLGPYGPVVAIRSAPRHAQTGILLFLQGSQPVSSSVSHLLVA